MVVYHASHEQFAPSELMKFGLLAEEQGFEAIHSSDHFHPWSERQGQSGFSFAWLGAAMQAIALPFGVICAPGQRYHPAIVAQATATLAELFDKRLWVAFGSGEAVNEKITGEEWPTKEERNARLLECIMIIKKLYAGEEVSWSGRVKVNKAKLYTRPKHIPLLLGAALSERTAALHGSWSDGLLTSSCAPQRLQKVIKAFQSNGGKGKPIFLKVQLSYARSKHTAVSGAYDQWRNNVLDTSLLNEVDRVNVFDRIGNSVTMQNLEELIAISEHLAEHVQWLRAYLDMGCDHLILHNVNRNQEDFIKDFGSVVLPDLKKYSPRHQKMWTGSADQIN